MPKSKASKDKQADQPKDNENKAKIIDGLALDDAIDLLRHLLSLGQKFKVIQILRDLKTNIENHDLFDNLRW